ncbi:MAG: barstar family protein [Labrys sp. (in: a-proteobacteria)]
MIRSSSCPPWRPEPTSDPTEDRRSYTTPRDVTGWYADILGIPEYFGANWDAFDECLRDLSWVKERRLVLFHRDVPIAANPKDRRIYLEVLANAATDWRPGEAHELIVAFDPACELKLHAAIRES